MSIFNKKYKVLVQTHFNISEKESSVLEMFVAKVFMPRFLFGKDKKIIAESLLNKESPQNTHHYVMEILNG